MAPLIYVSSYFEQRESEYYDRLQYVRERGEVREWLIIFLDAIAVQAADAVARSEQLSDLREQYRVALSGSRSRTIEVVDLSLTRPILTVRYVMDELGLSQPGANNLLKQLTDLEILRVQGEGRGVRHRWFAHDVLDVLDPKPSGLADESA